MKKLLILATLVACTKSTPPEAPKTEAKKLAAPTTLVVYSGRSEALAGPILQKFDAAHEDIVLDLRYNGTPALAAQVAAEGDQCPADVLFFQESGFLAALAPRLHPLPEAIRARADASMVDAEGKWIGLSGRLRTLVYNTQKLGPDTLPKSLSELADPKYKGLLGWAPENASFQAHVSALRHLWGEEATKKWLEGVKANAPARFPKNAPQVEAAASGEIAIGWVNHYYLHKLEKPGYTAANWSFPAEGDAGNVLMLASAGIMASSKAKPAAERLIAYLLSDEAQGYFANEAFEYPVVASVKTHEKLKPLAEVKLAKLDQRHLADLESALALMRSLGIE